MKQDEYLKEFSDEELEKILFRTWIFTFGFASLVNQGFIENPDMETIIKTLDESCTAIIEYEKQKKAAGESK